MLVDRITPVLSSRYIISMNHSEEESWVAMIGLLTGISQLSNTKRGEFAKSWDAFGALWEKTHYDKAIEYERYHYLSSDPDGRVYAKVLYAPIKANGVKFNSANTLLEKMGLKGSDKIHPFMIAIHSDLFSKMQNDAPPAYKKYARTRNFVSSFLCLGNIPVIRKDQLNANGILSRFVGKPLEKHTDAIKNYCGVF